MVQAERDVFFAPLANHHFPGCQVGPPPTPTCHPFLKQHGSESLGFGANRRCFRSDKTFALKPSCLSSLIASLSHKSKCFPPGEMSPPLDLSPTPLACHPTTHDARRWWQRSTLAFLAKSLVLTIVSVVLGWARTRVISTWMFLVAVRHHVSGFSQKILRKKKELSWTFVVQTSV